MNALRRLGRALVVLLSRLVFGGPGGGGLGEVRRVLVIRTDERVGNVLLTIPLLRALRAGLPEARIVFLHAASKTSLVRGLPYVDRLEPFEKKRFFRRPWAFLLQLLRLRRERFDVVLEAGHYHAFSLTAALLSRAVRPRAIIGHDRGSARHFFDYAVPPPEGMVQDVEVKLSLLGPLGIPPSGLELETPLARNETAREEMEATLLARGIRPERMLVVNPGARMAIRRWDPSAYGRVAARLGETFGLHPVILWGPGEERLAREVLVHAGPAAQLAPRTNLEELAALLGLARAFVTNDTGPMHLGVACGVPTLAIFLATSPARWGHRTASFAAVEVGEMEVDAAIEALALAAEGLFAPVERREAG